MHIPDHIQIEFEGLETRLLRIVTAALKNSQESSWIDVHYTGESKETARPTICVGCTNTKRVRTAIRKNLTYNTNIFDLAVMKDAVRRSKSTDTRRSQAGETDAAMNRGHHERPICGSSIGAWRYREHSPAVTFGGVVLVDGEPYGMTVHHLLEDPEAEEKQSQARAGAEPESDHDEDDEDDDDENSDGKSMGGTCARCEESLLVFRSIRTVLILSSTDELSTAFDDTLSITSEEDEEDGFTNGIRIGEGHSIVLTQPALDDVDENFFPCDEDRDEDHIDSHRLGHVYASSGLRRSNNEDGVSHEIDWLLMKLDDERLQPYNVIAGGKRFCPEESLFTYRPKLLEPVCRQDHPAREDSYPRRIMGSGQLSGLDVHCIGRTSGLAQGKISQRMRWVRPRSANLLTHSLPIVTSHSHHTHIALTDNPRYASQADKPSHRSGPQQAVSAAQATPAHGSSQTPQTTSADTSWRTQTVSKSLTSRPWTSCSQTSQRRSVPKSHYPVPASRSVQ